MVDSGLVGPAESAALDEAILEARLEGTVPSTLHFYVRSGPTISLGYFQKVDETVNTGECRKLGVTIVRRRSGGSSIFTDQGQLIYALVFKANELQHDREGCFRAVLSPLAEAISRLGVDARYRPMNDIEIGGRKVSGSAQLRVKDAVLIHGTVILDTDLEAMDRVLRSKVSQKPSERVTTIVREAGTNIDMSRLKAEVVKSLGSALSVDFEKAEMTPYEREAVEKLVADRYGRDEWNSKF